jgi:hypothetical protein
LAEVEAEVVLALLQSHPISVVVEVVQVESSSLQQSAPLQVRHLH